MRAVADALGVGCVYASVPLLVAAAAYCTGSVRYPNSRALLGFDFAKLCVRPVFFVCRGDWIYVPIGCTGTCRAALTLFAIGFLSLPVFLLAECVRPERLSLRARLGLAVLQVAVLISTESVFLRNVSPYAEVVWSLPDVLRGLVTTRLDTHRLLEPADTSGFCSFLVLIVIPSTCGAFHRSGHLRVFPQACSGGMASALATLLTGLLMRSPLWPHAFVAFLVGICVPIAIVTTRHIHDRVRFLCASRA